MQVAHNTGSDSTCDVTYNFAYDSQNRRTTVKVGTQLLSENVYNTTKGDIKYGTLTKSKFGNGGEVRYSYDAFKRVTGIQYDADSEDRYKFEYGANGQLARVTDNLLNRTTLSEYDISNRPMRKTTVEGTTNVYLGEVTYDEYSNLASFREQVGSARTAYRTDFTYDTENKPTKLTYGSTSNQVVYAYDDIGRMTTRTATVGGKAYAATYGYTAGGHGTGTTTGLIASISQTGGNFTYTYDDNGNITSVVQDGKSTYYEYDALGQLIRVNDQNDATSGSTGTTWVYKYDRGGNIEYKKRYAYTTASIADTTTPLESVTFSYTNANWKDQLKAVNGVSIAYDNIGNPTSDGTWTYTWEKGRQLKSMAKSGETVSFKYNADGLRVQKVATSTGTTNYTLHGKNIVHMTQGSNSLHFFYDASNKPTIVDFNGTKYAYVHNLQGDIVAILDSNGSIVVQYKYDAWGRIISKTGSLASTLGTVQPFRYRGYVYDEETGLYYLRSRYYRPQWMRFISEDQVIVCALIELNAFGYCGNSPILFSDSTGNEKEPGNGFSKSGTKFWYYCVDEPYSNKGVDAHIHIGKYRAGKWEEEYCERIDGSQHHGDIPVASNKAKKIMKKDRMISKDWPPKNNSGSSSGGSSQFTASCFSENGTVGTSNFSTVLPYILPFSTPFSTGIAVNVSGSYMPSSFEASSFSVSSFSVPDFSFLNGLFSFLENDPILEVCY